MDTIKVYAHEPGHLSKAIMRVMATFQPVEGDDAIDKADAILVTKREHLSVLYRKDRLFLFVLDGHGSRAGLPENVFPISPKIFEGENSILTFGEWAKSRIGKKVLAVSSESEQIKDTDIVVLSKEYRVLVLDNDMANRQIAEKVLSKHTVSLYGRMAYAVAALNEGEFDAVLTDMQMPLDTHFKSLSPNFINPGQDVPYGFAMIFEATKRGIPVAVVTDGNHHSDWVSAMFDNIKGATVNGQKVLFFNNIGKRWDIALKELLEGGK